MRVPRPLDAVEIRVLGCLLEKEQATPEYYPLTLNALVAACNQKSNREPVMDLREFEVRGALNRLREDVLVWVQEGARVERYEHNLTRRWRLDPPAKAIITELLLRGPQTPGELRGRSGRLHPWQSLAELEDTLRAMAAEEEPLVLELPREIGRKEPRWAHLVGGPVAAAPSDSRDASVVRETLADRVNRLEARLAHLAEQVEALTVRLEPGGEATAPEPGSLHRGSRR